MKKPIKEVLPFTPREILIIPISEKHFEYSEDIKNKLKLFNIKTTIDYREDIKIGKKIREGEMYKKLIIILGDNEIKNKTLIARDYLKVYHDSSTYIEEIYTFEDFIKKYYIEVYRDLKLTELGIWEEKQT